LLPPTHSTLKVRTIGFVDLPFVFTLGEGRRTAAVKPDMIRFGKIAVFSEIQKPFFIRKPANSTVEVHTIRFVCFPVIVAKLQMPESKCQIKPKIQMPKRATITLTVQLKTWVTS
jgi:hypothetical protein